MLFKKKHYSIEVVRMADGKVINKTIAVSNISNLIKLLAERGIMMSTYHEIETEGSYVQLHVQR